MNGALRQPAVNNLPADVDGSQVAPALRDGGAGTEVDSHLRHGVSELPCAGRLFPSDCLIKRTVSRRRAWQALTVVICCLRLSVCGGALPDSAEQTTGEQPSSNVKYTKLSLRGQVVWMADALRDRFGIETDDDVAHAVVALEDEEGRLYPLLKDTRGRSFHTDERLRNIDLELLVRRYPGSPAVQVVRVYAIKPDGKYQLDYWCDVCSIAMYELKPCECCQGPTRLRERRVDDAGLKAGDTND